MQRYTVHFSGNVQGVGFRYTARQTAMGYQVGGYVQNLPDGRVRLVAEGDAGELRRFVEAVQEAMDGYIHQTELEEAPARDEFSTRGPGRFTIRA